MKIIITTTLFLFILSPLSFTQWYQQNSGVTGDVTAIRFLNESKGYATSGYTYLSTTDGGSNWNAHTGLLNDFYKDVFFINQNIGWLLGRNIWQYQPYRFVANTTNGGTTWYTTLNQMSPWHLYSLHFVNENIGWVVGTVGTVLKTNDNLHWEYQISNTQSYLNSVFFIDSLNGWAVGDHTINSGSNIIKTSDGGINWLPREELTIHNLRTVFFEDINNGWIAGDNGMLFKTIDSGSNWSFQETGVDTNYLNRFLEIFFVDQENGWIVGTNGLILYSNDGGQSWNTQESGTSADLNCVFFIDEITGWTAGEDGIILHTTNGGVSAIEDDGNLTYTFNIEQNYPNPFNPSTVIEFSLPEDVSNVKLSVYNALGEKVAELVNSSLAAGRYSYQWNAKKVATGMYIYELRTDKFASVKKMLLLK